MVLAADNLPASFARRAPVQRDPTRSLTRDAWRALVPIGVAAVALPLALRFDSSHVVTASLLGAVLIGTTLYSRRSGLLATLLYLLFLGDYRRFVGFLSGYPESDPLLLVAPAAAAVLFCCALFEQRLSLRGPLAKLVAALMLLMAFGMLNPLQGGLDVGVAGALFYLVPLLWFWIGRAYVTRELLEFLSLRMLVAVGALATAWGLYQNYFGLLAFEQAWVERIGYGALYISDEVVRAIAFFNSSAEYQRFLLVTAVSLLAAWLAQRSKLALALPVVLVALFLAAARGPIVMFAGAAVVLWAVAGRSAITWPARFVAGAAMLGAALLGALLFLQTVTFGERVGAVVDRQVEGLLDPTNERTSTAVGHLQMVVDGIVAGVTTPAGQGLGATTLAASKFGARTINAELDFANIMLSLGILGGLLYAAIIVTVLRTSLAWWRAARETTALVTLGIVVVTFGGWLIGGEYSMAALVWLYVGAMDNLASQARRQQLRSRRRAHRPGHA
jgi:hypothetical protein